ncbi:MAG: hypothetical protein PHW31_01070 [Candidatus Pacebacteria bacterium]|nr:hypothetical protein [Candidatus Paceibacterota bacterium]
MQWTTTKLITIGGLGVIMVLAGLLGNALVAITGIPGVGSFINSFLGVIVYAFCALLIRKFGAVAIMGVVYGILALPLPSMGTPGFFPKILIAGMVGLTVDLVYQIFKKKEKLAAIIIGIDVNIIGILILAGFFKIFKVPGAEKFIKIFVSPLIAVMIILGILGGLVGYLILKKIKHTSVVKRIQGEQQLA